VLGRGGCPSGQTAVKEGRCFNAGTSVARDNRLETSVQTHFFDSGSAAAVGRQERWTQRLFVWLAKGEDGGNTSRAAVARGEHAGCTEKHAGEATYAGEGARTRWSCGGARPPNFQTRRSHGRAHWTWRLRYGRAGVHTENAWKQTRRQRFGVTPEGVHAHGNARCVPVF